MKLRQRTNKIFARLFTRHPVLVKLWTKRTTVIKFSDTPWTPLTKPANRCRLALVTTGGVNHRHFSFMGHIKNSHVSTLLRETAPRVASAIKTDGVDIAILTPA